MPINDGNLGGTTQQRIQKLKELHEQASLGGGPEAIEQFRKLRPDVTLMDLHLPCMTGVEAIIAIRREFPDALILVMATEVDDGQIQRALAAGARGCLHKGMPMVDLLAIIHDVVEESKDVERE